MAAVDREQAALRLLPQRGGRHRGTAHSPPVPSLEITWSSHLCGQVSHEMWVPLIEKAPTPLPFCLPSQGCVWPQLCVASPGPSRHTLSCTVGIATSLGARPPRSTPFEAASQALRAAMADCFRSEGPHWGVLPLDIEREGVREHGGAEGAPSPAPQPCRMSGGPYCRWRSPTRRISPP